MNRRGAVELKAKQRFEVAAASHDMEYPHVLTLDAIDEDIRAHGKAPQART